MNGTASRVLRLSGGLAGLIVLGWVLTGQAAKPERHGIPLPTDWSHRHMIFSHPSSREGLARASKDPRYWQQLYRRQSSMTLPPSESDIRGFFPLHPHENQKTFARDWAMTLGAASSSLVGTYPAKYAYDSSTANCGTATTPDYVVYSTGQASSGSQASIVAFSNLYSGCGGTVPSTYWAYNTAKPGIPPTPGTVVTSPIASLDGTQVAFVQTDGVGHGTVVLLKWAANDGTIGTPTAPTFETTGAQYASCTSSCMMQFNLTDTSGTQVDDETSSIYYDFTNDVAWVGDNIGLLHQFHPFFLGTPAEIRNTTWPASVSSSWLSSPVYDSGSNNVFVGDGGGYLHAVNASSASLTNSGQLDFGTGIVEGPLVDSVHALVYVFASSDGTTNCTSGVACAAVYQLSTSFTTGSTGTEATIGNSLVYPGSTPNPAYLGGFDSTYYNSANATGNLYVCGNTGSSPELFQVPITAGSFPASRKGTEIAQTTLATATVACSPVTDVPNPNTANGPSERVFLSVADHGHALGCGNSGCVLNFTVAEWQPSAPYVVGQQIFDGIDIQTVIAVSGTDNTGTSGATQPLWVNSTGTTLPDGTVTWMDQGALDARTISGWEASHTYTVDDRILDSNNNVEIATTVVGISGGSTPSWNLNAGGTTPDGGVTWTNAGSVGTFALQATGGATGIISDNVVPTTTLAGASQIYFTTLGSQTCTTSGTTGGCAVQASQPALQ
jgi:hypothetical protein